MSNNMDALAVTYFPPWQQLQERPTWLVPIAASMLLGAMLVVAYFNQVDVAWLIDQIVNHDARLLQLTEERRRKIEAMMDGIAMEKAYLATALICVPLARFAEGLYYHLAGKLLGLRLGYRHWLSLTCWSSLPLLLPVVAALLTLTLHHSEQATFEALNGLSLNELFFHRPQGAPGYALASTLTILHPWAWALAASGIRAWTGRSWWFSASFSLLPWTLLYGGWAIAAVP